MDRENIGTINTAGANEFAKNASNKAEDVALNWWEFFSNYRVKKWRQELNTLSDETGISYEYVCGYIGAEASSLPGFYRRMPKLRETYIGIGMAYKQSLDTINRWLVKYGAKRKLYIKDVISDLIWVYLINVNAADNDSDINYYRQYDACKHKIEDVYGEIWGQSVINDVDTVMLGNDLKSVAYDLEHAELKRFVKEHIDAFKTAYAKPRKYLKKYLTQILLTKNTDRTKTRTWTLNMLRGYLDDSMINYLSGADETISIVEDSEGNRTLGIKYIPKNKRAHIAICLALGMTVEGINKYLEMMGYFTLDATNAEEGLLINLLSKWDAAHPLQKKYKSKYFNGEADVLLSEEDELAAVEEMLRMRVDIKDAYLKEQNKIYGSGNGNGTDHKKFPYLNN